MEFANGKKAREEWLGHSALVQDDVTAETGEDELEDPVQDMVEGKGRK